jgi:ketosteroid isomerase-like protein
MDARDAAGARIMNEPYYATSRDAERAFYDAFQRADLDEMMKVWADEDTIICIHPMGARLDGREAVARSWEQLFAGSAPMRFELTEVSCTLNGDLAVHCVTENIDHGAQLGQRSLVLATNIYQSTGQGWRILVHHASPGVLMQTRDQESHSTLH